MKLYMREKYLTFREDFNITDRTGMPLYRVKGRLLSIGRQLRIIDVQKNKEVAEVKQKVTSLFPRMDVYMNNQLQASVQKKFSLLNPHYQVKALGWTVKGNVLKHHYRILDKDNKVIARVKKKLLTFTDTFECQIHDVKVDPVMIISVVLSIDLALDKEEQARKGKKDKKREEK